MTKPKLSVEEIKSQTKLINLDTEFGRDCDDNFLLITDLPVLNDEYKPIQKTTVQYVMPNKNKPASFFKIGEEQIIPSSWDKNPQYFPSRFNIKEIKGYLSDGDEFVLINNEEFFIDFSEGDFVHIDEIDLKLFDIILVPYNTTMTVFHGDIINPREMQSTKPHITLRTLEVIRFRAEQVLSANNASISFNDFLDNYVKQKMLNEAAKSMFLKREKPNGKWFCF